jgi:hypothetical protein
MSLSTVLIKQRGNGQGTAPTSDSGSAHLLLEEEEHIGSMLPQQTQKNSDNLSASALSVCQIVRQ